MLESFRVRNEFMKSILTRKTELGKSKAALRWCFVNCFAAAMVFLDMSNGSVSRFFESEPTCLWYCELGLGIVFTINTCIDLMTYIWPSTVLSPVKVSPAQKKLFGLNDPDIGFETLTPEETDIQSSDSKMSSPRLPFCLPSLQHSSTMPSSSPSYMSPSLDYPAASWTSSGSNRSLSASSWTYYPGNISYDLSSSSQSLLNTSLSPQFSPNVSGGLRNIRHRISTSPVSVASTSSEQLIRDAEDLDRYLAECEETEQLKQLVNSDSTRSSVPSVWNYQRSVGELSLPLQKYLYQPASRSPQFSATHKDDSSAVTHSGEGIWMKLKVSDRQLNTWVENLRKWLSQTVIMRLVSEINAINDTLTRLGSAELHIGETSISTLRQVAVTKSQHVPTFATVLPYLDMTSNQEYLVQRLKDLSKGGCMSEFRWNGGGTYKGKPWSEDLPTDSSIVMHLFCTYLDSRLPPNPHYPDWKTFTSQYFRRTPDKPIVGKEALCIYQSRIFPPHYQLIINEDTWDLPKGRNNLFYTILLFLYHIKTEQCGMLGRVNLGPSGINVLWVVET